MKVVLVGPEIEENLSIRYLAASLAQTGIESRIVSFIHGGEAARVARRVIRETPDLVGLSLVAQARYRDFARLIGLLREKGYRGHITAGGHFASLRAGEILQDTPGLDTILHHEGERRIVQLAGWLGCSPEPPESFDGISWRDANGNLRHRPARAVAALDDLPVPARRSPSRTLGVPTAPIVASRGCAGSCSFCSISAWHGQVPGARLRLRAPEAVASEMTGLHREHGVRLFVFHDDDFVHPDPRRSLARCREILDGAARAIGEPFAFVIKCRPDDVREELFAYLRARGLVRAYVGIESHAASGIRTLNRRLTPEVNEDALDILRRLDIYACFNLLLFDPDTTVEALDENLGFLDRHPSVPFDIARTELYAGAALEGRMIREGRVRGDYRGYDYRISDPISEAIFRTFARVLWDRHFGGRSVLHHVQDLALRRSLLRRLYPEARSADLDERIASMILEINRDTVAYVKTIRDRVVAGVCDENFVAGLRAEVNRRSAAQSRRLTALTFEIGARATMARRPLARHRAVVRLATSVPGAALVLGCLSCVDDKLHVCDPPPPPAIHFSTDIEPFLDGTCATEGCHDAVTASAGLSLQQGHSRANLVNVQSIEVPSMVRVRPGRADSSYLVHKLQGTQGEVGGSGDRMPKNRAPNPTFIAKLIEWIRQGAQND